MFPYRQIDSEKVFQLSFSTNIHNHVPEIFILRVQNLILRTRSCGTGFITQSSWFFHFYLTTLVWWKCFVLHFYQFRRGIWGGPALKYFYMIHRGGRLVVTIFGQHSMSSHVSVLLCHSFIRYCRIPPLWLSQFDPWLTLFNAGVSHYNGHLQFARFQFVLYLAAAADSDSNDV